MGNVRNTVIFSGTVQGVGFRYTAANLARRRAVAGSVRNLRDGRVELVVEGEQSEISALVADIEKEMAGYIRNTDTAKSPATGEFVSFNIAH